MTVLLDTGLMEPKAASSRRRAPRGWAAVARRRRSREPPPGGHPRPPDISPRAVVRLENVSPNALLYAGVPVRGTEQREGPAFSVDGVLPGGERHVAASGATFPDGEADQLQAA